MSQHSDSSRIIHEKDPERFALGVTHILPTTTQHLNVYSSRNPRISAWSDHFPRFRFLSLREGVTTERSSLNVRWLGRFSGRLRETPLFARASISVKKLPTNFCNARTYRSYTKVSLRGSISCAVRILILISTIHESSRGVSRTSPVDASASMKSISISWIDLSFADGLLSVFFSTDTPN